MRLDDSWTLNQMPLKGSYLPADGFFPIFATIPLIIVKICSEAVFDRSPHVRRFSALLETLRNTTCQQFSRPGETAGILIFSSERTLIQAINDAENRI